MSLQSKLNSLKVVNSLLMETLDLYMEDNYKIIRHFRLMEKINKCPNHILIMDNRNLCKTHLSIQIQGAASIKSRIPILKLSQIYKVIIKVGRVEEALVGEVVMLLIVVEVG